VTCVTTRYLPNLRHLFHIAQVDTAVVLDLAPLPHRNRNSFVNRNRILNRATGQAQWLTVPVSRHSRNNVRNTLLDHSDRRWSTKHYNALNLSYPGHERRAPGFLERFREATHDATSLMSVNSKVLDVLCVELGLNPLIAKESDLVGEHSAWHRSDIADCLGATGYLAGAVEWGLMRESGEIDLLESMGIGVIRGPEIIGDAFAAEIFEFYSAAHAVCSLGSPQSREMLSKLRGQFRL
jgi:WbqC-like protein family